MLASKMSPCEFKLLAKEISQMLAGIDESAQLLAVDYSFDFEFVLHPPITPEDTSRSIYRFRTVPNDGRCVNPHFRCREKRECGVVSQRKTLSVAQMEPVGSSRREAAFFASETRYWGKVDKDANVALEERAVLSSRWQLNSTTNLRPGRNRPTPKDPERQHAVFDKYYQ